jgi:molecular chaperone HtpG
MKKGHISVNTENIFPIIKKFLYSDHEIFLRELVSNATDACQKLNTLNGLGEFKGDIGDFKIKVALNTEKKTLTISDNGVGMTAEEIEKYINQLAFSGAEEFVEKYKDKASGIIGHFGLGFYSAFMVADTVEIDSLSHAEGAEAAHWTCDGSTSYKITKGKRKTRGTDIILHINDDSSEFNNTYKIKSLLDKYCRFLPVEIEYEDKVINNTKPLWLRTPSELTDDDYINFYDELYPMAESPLFWIHLNVDFPFNLTGILYFPKIKNAIEAEKHKVQLYSNQVYVTDNVKEIMPEYLTLLHGVIDSPDIPLNVSRSSLQSDGNVKKITGHISKKVASKLAELFKADRKDFELKWDYMDVFVKYGILSEEKFAEKAKEFCLISDVDKKRHTLQEFVDLSKTNQVDKNNKTILLYANNKDTEYTSIKEAKERGYAVALFDGVLDNHFTGYLEQNFEDLMCKRVDAAPVDKLVEKDEETVNILSEEETAKLKDIFAKQIADDTYEVQAEALSPKSALLAVTEDEFSRRMQDMSRMQGNGIFEAMPQKYNVVINTNHPKAKIFLNEKAEDKMKKAFNLALLSKGLLKGEALFEFLKAEEESI